VRNRIARVNSDGTLDTGFDPNASPFYVMTAALQPDGKVLLGGGFTGLKPNGAAVATPRNWFARLFNDPATQTLTVPDTSQTLWSRSGAGPELFQVTFELSTDGGTNWSPLGNGTRVGTTSNWKLTGLSLPTSAQVRARGFTTNGFFNGSSGLIEQVAAYTASAPVPLTLAISQVGTATYSVGFNTTSITMTFTSPPNMSVNMQYSTDLSSWTAFGGNPVSTGATGTFPVTFTATGDQTAIWNKKLFFKASTP